MLGCLSVALYDITVFYLNVYDLFLQIFLQYSDETEAIKAKGILHGRKFGGNTVSAVYYPEANFIRGEYDS